MAQVIQFPPKSSNRSGRLRAARERCGLSHAQFAALLGREIGRDHLSPGTIRAWEAETVRPPPEVVDAAQRIAQQSPASDVLPPVAPAFIPPPPADLTAHTGIDA